MSLVKIIRLTLHRHVTDTLDLDDDVVHEAQHDAELAEVLKVCETHPDAVVQVYDCDGHYLYTPQGDEEDAPILGDPQAGVRAVLEHQQRKGLFR